MHIVTFPTHANCPEANDRERDGLTGQHNCERR
jgi:hypothetical protein